MTTEAIKFKLASHCGTLASEMILHLKDSSGKLVAVLAEPHRKLGYYSPEDGCALHLKQPARCRSMHVGCSHVLQQFCQTLAGRVLTCSPVQLGVACHRHQPKLAVSKGLA